MYQQRVDPDLGTVDSTGMCLRFTQTVFGAPARHKSAAIAAQHTKFRHYTRVMPDVACVVWFSHWGTYGAPPSYEDWGHVVTWVPGRGFLSSPGKGRGQTWYGSLEEIERVFAGSFLFWSEDINGLRVCEPGEEDDMYSDSDRKRDDETHWMVGQVKAAVDDIHRRVKIVHANSDVDRWALTDPVAGLRKMVADVGRTAGDGGKLERLTEKDVERIADAVNDEAADRLKG